MLQQAIGEAPGGDAAIQTDPLVNLDRKRLQTRQQLLTTAGDEAGRLLHHQLLVRADFSARFVQHRADAVPHLAGTDQLLRLLTGAHQPSGQQLQIQSLFYRHFVIKADTIPKKTGDQRGTPSVAERIFSAFVLP